MIKIMKLRINKGIVLLLTLVMILSLAACNKTEDDEDKDKEIEEQVIEKSESELFDEFMDNLAIEILKGSPLTATFNIADLEAYDLNYLKGELDSQSLEGYDEQVEELEALIDELMEFDTTELTQSQLMNYDLALFDLKADLTQSKYKYIGSALDANGGVHIIVPLSLMQQELNSKEDVELFIQRVGEVDRLFDESIEYEEARLTEGYALPSAQYEDVIEQIDAILENEDGSPAVANEYMMYLSFVDKMNDVDELSEEDKKAFAKTYETIVQDEIFPAINRLRDQAERMAKESTNDGNISDTPDGKEYYEEFIKIQTFNELTVEELREWAKLELDRVVTGFQTFAVEHPEVLAMDIMGVFPEYSSFDELYVPVEQMYADQFKDYGVEKATEFVIPDYLEEHMPPGFYFPLSADGGAYGNMYLTQGTYDEPTVDTFITYAHENIPGHHLYFTYVANSDEPLYRKMTGYDSYVEGWAKHVENIAFNYMGLDEAVIKFFELNGDYMNAMTVLIDIQYHYDGISYVSAVNKYKELGYDGETAEKAVNRMMISPAETVHYMYGAYKMKQFQQEFMDHYEDGYDVKEYHDFILRHYGLPFFTVKEEVGKLFNSEVITEE